MRGSVRLKESYLMRALVMLYAAPTQRSSQANLHEMPVYQNRIRPLKWKVAGVSNQGTIPHQPVYLFANEVVYANEPTTCAIPRMTWINVNITTTVAKLYYVSQKRLKTKARNIQKCPKLQSVPPITKQDPYIPRFRRLKVFFEYHDARPKRREEVRCPVGWFILHQLDQERIKFAHMSAISSLGSRCSLFAELAIR
jgi:hypothetical protein